MKKPALALPFTFGRATAELAIIVAGVLIALGAQSWWEGLEEDRARALAYRALSSDVDIVQQTLTSDSLVAVIPGAILWLLDPATDLQATPDSVYWRRAVHALWNYPSTAPRLTVVDALSGSEALDLLPIDLRARLSRFEATRYEYSDARRDLYTFQQDRLDALLVDRIRLDEAMALGETGSGLPAPEEPVQRIDEAFLRSPEVRSRLAGKYSLVTYVVDYHGRLRAQLDSIRAAIPGAP